MLNKHFKIIIWGIICIVLSGVMVQNIDYLPDNSDYVYHTQNVSSQINAQLKYIESEAIKVEQSFQQNDNLRFSNLIEPFKYPYFIFNEQKLLFWSDYSVLPLYNRLSGNYTYKLLEDNKNKYLIYKKEIFKKGRIFELFFYVPLYKHYQIKNNYLEGGFNKEIFSHSQIQISDVGIKDKFNVYSEKGDYLFSIVYDDNLLKDRSLWYAVSFLIMLAGMILIVFFVYESLQQMELSEKYEWSWLTLVAALAFFRFIMLFFNFPYFLVEWELFNPRFYAASVLSPTVGDLLLNHISMLLVVLFFFNNYRKSSLFQKLEQISTKQTLLFSIVLVSLSAFSIYFLFGSVKAIFLHSREVLDISRNIDFNFTKFIFILVFVILSINYFIVNQILARLFIKINKERNQNYLFMNLIFCNSLMAFYSVYLHEFNWLISLFSVLYFGFIVYYQLPKTINLFRYNTYIYIFLAALVCSMSGAIAIFEVTETREIVDKQKFSNNLLIENDIQGEFLLNEISEKIKNDAAIKGVLTNHFTDKEIIVSKIKKVYLNTYFDKYDIDILLFNSKGEDIHSINKPDLDSFKKKYHKKEYITQFQDLYYVDESMRNSTSRYLSFIDLDKDGIVIGYILLDLKLKKVIPNSVFPELLVDERFGVQGTPAKYSYAIFNNEVLQYTYGDFNYTDSFNKYLFYNVLKTSELSFVSQSYEHLIIKANSKKILVISSPEYPVYHVFSNFSLLLLVLLFSILILIVILSSYKNYVQNLQLSLSAKIQVYLNVAFFLPLIIVSIATLGIMSSDYKTYINESFLEKVSRARVHLADKLDHYLKKRTNKEELNNLLSDVAKYSESDINIYSVQGKLLASSQPSIYQSGLLSGLLNPEAFSKIIDQKSRTLMLQEKIGTFRYNSVYAAIKSSDSGKMIGVVSIPYYHSSKDLEKHLIEVLTGIINIFTIVFIVFMALSFVAARLLTEPLVLITQKIKKISFQDTNEPLIWNSKDEIGLLVGAYNKMLLKLVDSKKKLSQQEKESAWREMAQQVAHEIKNPLTPMKLSIQHLQRALKSDRDDIKDMLDRNLNNLLYQVDTLSDIATSFSAFAKMPIPVNETFELSALLQQTVDLYNHSENTQVVFACTYSQDIMVYFDKQLMGRIISNLLLNAIQAVPKEKNPLVIVSLKLESEKVLIEVKDNGTGIPEEIKDKVFVPNFSTKYTGSGIGLAVAKRGVEHANGKIWFETQLNTGTTFFIELPLVKIEQ